jgi:nicotinamide phosphoribosyltransferase
MTIYNNNIMLLTDGYKPSQWKQYVSDMKNMYSYFESRTGATYPYTVFFGLQPILEKYLTGRVVTRDRIEEAENFYKSYFGRDDVFNKQGWEYILEKHAGRLPIEIKAVEEGTRVPTNNVLMTITATDDNCGWLVGWLETILTHVWYGSTVATKSSITRDHIEAVGNITGDTFLDFHVHDFGYRGVSSQESAEIGGAAHLLSFKGTDTLAGIIAAVNYYDGDINDIGFSIPASEHSVMCSLGEEGEVSMMNKILDAYPDGLVAFPIDSYNVTRMMETHVPLNKDVILNRWKNGKGQLNRVVFRPDSPRFKDDTPEAQVLWLHETLANIFGNSLNDNGYKVLHPAVGVIYGDGLTTDDIVRIYTTLKDNGWSISNCVVGQGGGLLQKLNRDTQRFAFKCSSQQISGEWVNVQKKPSDITKMSKAGKMKLVKELSADQSRTTLTTYTETHPMYFDAKDELKVVFRDGDILNWLSFNQIRENLKNTKKYV